MRTTLDLDDDVLDAARELARQSGQSAGRVISRLVRERLAAGGAALPTPGQPEPLRNAAGFRPLAARGVIVGNDAVDRLREAEGV